MSAIERYDGIMYRALGYHSMSPRAQKYFQKHFLIVSGMYGILRPLDSIANYKLPIECRTLSHYWQNTITQTLIDLRPTSIVNLLPLSYKRMIDFAQFDIPITSVEFVDHAGKSLTHTVKNKRGEWMRRICEQGYL